MPAKPHKKIWHRKICRLAVIVGVLNMSCCKNPNEGTYRQQDAVGFEPEIVRIEGKSAWIGIPNKTLEYEVIKTDVNLRIQSKDGKLHSTFKILESGLLSIESGKFYRKDPKPDTNP